MAVARRLFRGRLARGALWVALGKVVGGVTALAIHATLARTLSTAELGAYFLLLSLVLAASVVSHLAFGQTAVRLIAGALASDLPGRARAAARQLALAALLGGGGAATLLALGGGPLAAWVSMPPLATVAPMAGAWLLLMTAEALLAELWRGLHDIRFATVFGGPLANLLALAGLVLLPLAGRSLDLPTAILVIACARALALACGAALLIGRLRRLAPVGHLAPAETLRAVVPLLLAALPTLMLEHAHVLLLGLLQSAAEVAVYGATVRLIAFVVLPLLMVNGVIAPMISDLHVRGDARTLATLLQGTAGAIGLPAVVALVVVIAFGGDLLQLVYGPGFAAGSWPLTLLCLAQVINVLTGSCGMVLLMAGRNLAMLGITGVAAALDLGLCLLLIPAHGMVGAALAHGLALIALNLGLLFGARHFVGVWTYAKPAPTMALLARRSLG